MRVDRDVPSSACRTAALRRAGKSLSVTSRSSDRQRTRMRSVSSATGPEGAATGSAARAASRSGSWRLSRAANDESVVTGPPRSTALRTVIVALLGLVAVHAITTPTFGGPEALTWAEVPDLSPGAGEVLIDV